MSGAVTAAACAMRHPLRVQSALRRCARAAARAGSAADSTAVRGAARFGARGRLREKGRSDAARNERKSIFDERAEIDRFADMRALRSREDAE